MRCLVFSSVPAKGLLRDHKWSLLCEMCYLWAILCINWSFCEQNALWHAQCRQLLCTQKLLFAHPAIHLKRVHRSISCKKNYYLILRYTKVHRFLHSSPRAHHRDLFSQTFLGQRLKEASFSSAPMTGYGVFSPYFLF